MGPRSTLEAVCAQTSLKTVAGIRGPVQNSDILFRVIALGVKSVRLYPQVWALKALGLSTPKRPLSLGESLGTPSFIDGLVVLIQECSI